MTLTTSIRDGFAVVGIEGRLTASGAKRFRETIQRLIADGTSRVVIDFAEASFVDSSGLGALVGSLKDARLAGGDLRIAAVPDPVRSVLRLTNLDRVLRCHETPDSAFDGR